MTKICRRSAQSRIDARSRARIGPRRSSARGRTARARLARPGMPTARRGSRTRHRGKNTRARAIRCHCPSERSTPPRNDGPSMVAYPCGSDSMTASAPARAAASRTRCSSSSHRAARTRCSPRPGARSGGSPGTRPRRRGGASPALRSRCPPRAGSRALDPGHTARRGASRVSFCRIRSGLRAPRSHRVRCRAMRMLGIDVSVASLPGRRATVSARHRAMRSRTSGAPSARPGCEPRRSARAIRSAAPAARATRRALPARVRLPSER